VISRALQDKLVCLSCRSPLHLNNNPLTLCCETCGKVYPIRLERFPDFLDSKNRQELESEILFWNKWFGGKPYADESDASYAKWIELISASPDSEVLEMGCGSGALLSRLPCKLKIGVDPVESLLANSSSFDAILAVSEGTPFPDESFDLVFFKHSLHHVQNKNRGLSEAIRILRKNGRLIIIEPNLEHPQRRITSNPKGLFRRMPILHKLIGPVESFQSAREVTVILERLGWDCTRLKYCHSDYDSPSIRQRLQRAYAATFGWVLDDRFIFPNYFIEFRRRNS
jgi:SAM-dependent methyltransferase